MKKIININLSGMVIPIEDSAYEKLQQYVESLRRYFANEEGRDEIINDIEGRIAELMNDKIKKGATAVTDNDMESIISSMGRVEDFESADLEGEQVGQQSNKQKEEYTYTEKKPRGRLYRDLNDKFIGGVCSGIANYLDVDPTIVRILFVILLFATGLGFLAYIILWIVLPSKDLEGHMGKRLYRNPDDRIIGGVAGGLAAYFNKSSKTIRLVFAAPILFNVLISIINGFTWHSDFNIFWNLGLGSLTGTFVLIYVILWIILPEANTPYEKMEMRGETVDINRIRQNVKEGMGNVKQRMKGWSEEVKESAQNLSTKAKEFSNTRGKAFAGEIAETVRSRRSGIGHAFGVIFKVFFLFIAGIIAFSLFMVLIALIFGGVAWWPVNNFLWTSKWQQILAWGTILFFFIVPLVAFITWIIRRISRVKSKKSYLGWIFGGLWLIGWIAMTLFVASVTKDFREYEHVDKPIEVSQPAGGKIIVAVTQPELEYSGGFGWMSEGAQGWDVSEDSLKIAAVKFNVIASRDDMYRVITKRYSFGKTEQDALNRASKIEFESYYRDSLLDLGNSYAIDRGSKFRGQYVEIEIQVPVGKKIRFDESVQEKLNSLNIKIRRGYRRNRINGITIDTDHDTFRFRTGIDYTMGIDGDLQSAGGENSTAPGNINNDYRYRESDSIELEKSIEKKKRELEKLEEKKNDILKDKSTTGTSISINKSSKGLIAKGPSPVSAMMEWF